MLVRAVDRFMTVEPVHGTASTHSRNGYGVHDAQRRMLHRSNGNASMKRIDETLRLGRQVAEINAVVPGIVSHRLMRLAWAGAAPSRSDRAELSRMSSEKWQAASQSAVAMTAFAMQQQTAMAQSFMRAMWAPWMGMSSPGSIQGPNPFAGMLSAGLAPYHRIATANARRLGKR